MWVFGYKPHKWNVCVPPYDGIQLESGGGLNLTFTILSHS